MPSNTNDTHPSTGDAFAGDIMDAQSAFRLAQRTRLREYIEALQPELAATYEREAVAFAHLADTVLEPALKRFIERSQTSGWHMGVVRENATDGVFGVATPGIRLLVSRNSLPDPFTLDFIDQTSFVGFHGNCPNHEVEMVTEVHRDASSARVERNERKLAYDAFDTETLHNLLMDFLRRLT